MSLVCASPDLIEAAGILVTVQDVNCRDRAKSHDTAGSGAGVQDETTSEGISACHMYMHVHTLKVVAVSAATVTVLHYCETLHDV